MQASAPISLPLKTTEIFNQAHLEQAIRELFPRENVVSNARKQSQVTNPSTGHFFEVDIWVPDLQLGFEFQDNYHYITTWYSHVTLDAVRQKDENKRDIANQSGLTLLGIPCWWDLNPGSLAATILFERPDLNVEYGDNYPISLNPPPNFFNINPVPDVGELMYASYPASVIPASLESPWWLGEKYDGIRSCWNPERQAVYGRSGIEIPVLQEISDALPATYLDCEAWFGRGHFADTQRLLKMSSVNWTTLRFVAFDEPGPPNQDLPFEDRYSLLCEKIPPDHHLVTLASRMWCDKTKQMSQMLDVTIRDGGEGIIVRKPLSLYQRGRSELLWKLKAIRGDMEALVMRVEIDKSLQLQLPSGITFVVLPHQSELTKVKKGDVVTFSFDNFSSNSVPVNPIATRIRLDTTWENVVKDFVQQRASATPQILTEHSLVEDAKKKRPKGFWTSEEKTRNIRSFFENFAKSRNFDPIIPTTWYTLAPELLQEQYSRYIFFKKFNGYVEALQSIFPNIGINPTKFDTIPHKYWADLKLRREFFCQFAKHSKFDPLVAENWYSVSRTHTLLLYKNTRSILTYYDGNYANALIHMFPDIGIDRRKLPNVPNKYWHSHLYRRDIKNMEIENSLQHRQVAKSEGSSEDLEVSQDAQRSIDFGTLLHNRKKWANEENQRAFFLSFAKSKNMDPLVAENWYDVSNAELIESNKDAKLMLNFYDGNLAKALSHLFPETVISRSKFLHGQRKVLTDREMQRDFFCAFARGKGFDPLLAEDWYTNAHTFKRYKGARALLAQFKGSIPKGLQAAFPELKWDNKKFKYPERKYESFKFQLDFFENFAKDRKFDPLVAENWYSIPIREIIRRRGAKSIMAYNQQNIAKALMKVFPNLELDLSRFRSKLKRNHWNSAANRRAFFEQYAREHKFSPLSANAWYKVNLDNFMQTKKAVSVMSIYRRRFDKALLDLFPEIGLDSSRIPKGRRLGSTKKRIILKNVYTVKMV